MILYSYFFCLTLCEGESLRKKVLRARTHKYRNLADFMLKLNCVWAGNTSLAYRGRKTCFENACEIRYRGKGSQRK